MGTQQFSAEVTTMRSEAERLSTFHSWPHNDKVEARKIAKAGFFHTGNDSEVKCFWCNTVLTDWQYGDQVMARHRSANPECPFIKNISDNVPLLNSETSVISQSSEIEMEGKKYLFLLRAPSKYKVRFLYVRGFSKLRGCDNFSEYSAIRQVAM